MAHPDRVRKFNCPEHNWIQVFGVRRINAFHFVLDGWFCINCNSIISRNEYDKIKANTKLKKN